MVHLWLLVATLSYTVPAREAPCCDSVCVSGDSTTVWHHAETMGWIEIWFAPRYGSWTKIRDKDVSGHEGELDTLQVPDDSLATYMLVARDAAGNRSCDGNTITVTGRVGVGPGPSSRPVYWIDLQGRKLDAKPTTPGIYWRVDGIRKPRRLVLVR